MIVSIQDPETERTTVVFGANDFSCGENLVEVWLHRSVNLHDKHDGYINVDGTVVSAVSEFDKVPVDVAEELSYCLYKDEYDVIVAVAPRFESTIKGVVACIKDEDTDTDKIEFIGNTEPIDYRVEQ